MSTQPASLYTEEEALAAARAAAEAAVDAAVPLAVQAAVAEERGKAAAQQVLDKAAAEAFQRQARNWRTAALVACGRWGGSHGRRRAGDGCIGAAGGAVAAGVWWVAEHWPWRKDDESVAVGCRIVATGAVWERIPGRPFF